MMICSSTWQYMYYIPCIQADSQSELSHGESVSQQPTGGTTAAGAAGSGVPGRRTTSRVSSNQSSAAKTRRASASSLPASLLNAADVS